MKSLLLSLILLSAASQILLGQVPVISVGGVVDAASYTQPVVPGSVVTIFGTNLADGIHSASTTPLPVNLGSTSVSVNGISAPLFYVSPQQINAQIPSSLAINDGAFRIANVVVTTSAGATAPVAVSVYEEGPGIFTADGSGCGQAAALNVAPDGSVSRNSSSNSAAPGDFITVFGTGFGPTYAPPPDGSPATAAQRTEIVGGYTIDTFGGTFVPPQYMGLALGFVGIDQANLQIPADTREGCAVPVSVYGAYLTSQTVSISIGSARGQCSDPPTQSYGSILLVKTISTGTPNDGEVDTLSATFTSGPALVRPSDESETLINSGSYIANVFSHPAPSRSCAVAGYVQLSVGSISVTGPQGATTVAPNSTSGSTAYSQNLPAGFVASGDYDIEATGNFGIGPFQQIVVVGASIQIAAVRPPVNTGDPFTVTWSGGSAEDVVKISLIYKTPLWEESDYTYTTAGAGSYSFMPICSGLPIASGGSGVYCGFGIPEINEVVVEQMPKTDRITTFQASGITGNIQASWHYRFVIGIPPV